MNTAHFEKTQRTTPRRSAQDMEAVRAKKGKRNKTQRGKDNWAHLQGTGLSHAEYVSENAIEHSMQRPAWEML